MRDTLCTVPKPDKPDRGPRRRPGWWILATALRDRGLPLPPVLDTMVETGRAVPIAIGSREGWSDWATANGFDDTAVATLADVLAALVKSNGYHRAVARPGSVRYDVEGVAVEPVSDEHRAGSVATLKARGIESPTDRDGRRAAMRAERDRKVAAGLEALRQEKVEKAITMPAPVPVPVPPPPPPQFTDRRARVLTLGGVR